MPSEICSVNLQIKVLADFFIIGISPLKSVSPELNTHKTEKLHSWALKKCSCIMRIKLWIHSFPQNLVSEEDFEVFFNLDRFYNWLLAVKVLTDMGLFLLNISGMKNGRKNCHAEKWHFLCLRIMGGICRNITFLKLKCFVL